MQPPQRAEREAASYVQEPNWPELRPGSLLALVGSDRDTNTKLMLQRIQPDNSALIVVGGDVTEWPGCLLVPADSELLRLAVRKAKSNGKTPVVVACHAAQLSVPGVFPGSLLTLRDLGVSSLVLTPDLRELPRTVRESLDYVGLLSVDDVGLMHQLYRDFAQVVSDPYPEPEPPPRKRQRTCGRVPSKPMDQACFNHFERTLDRRMNTFGVAWLKVSVYAPMKTAVALTLVSR